MVILEYIVNDEQVDAVADIIQGAACTHSAGDGKIVVYEVSGVFRIRTGDRLQRIE